MAPRHSEGVIKKARFTEEQMVKILREADKAPVAEIAKQHGVSDQRIYGWRKRYGTSDAADVKRLRQLEQENAWLKKLVANRDLELDVMREISREKWRARRLGDDRWSTRGSAGCRQDGRARCSRSLDQPWGTRPFGSQGRAGGGRHPKTAEELYLDLLKRSLTRAAFARETVRHTIDPSRLHLRVLSKVLRAMLTPLHLELVHLRQSGLANYVESTHAARTRMEDAETMLGIRQLDQMQDCITDVVRRNVPGDLWEAGVWRGGMTIFMRGILKAMGENQRRVWVVDSFEGLPDPEKSFDSFGWKKGAMAVSLDQVKENCARYGLLDEQVVFLKGFFNETLPDAGINALSVLRVDADLYESTRGMLDHLYPKLSVGGYAIFDDYQNLKDCQRAIDEYRLRCHIEDPVVKIDKRAVYWVKSAGEA